MKAITLKTVERHMSELGATWATCDVTRYSIFTDRPYWAVKIPAGRGVVLTFRLDPRSIAAVSDRVFAARSK